jgi:hypothetical protein
LKSHPLLRYICKCIERFSQVAWLLGNSYVWPALRIRQKSFEESGKCNSLWCGETTDQASKPFEDASPSLLAQHKLPSFVTQTFSIQNFNSQKAFEYGCRRQMHHPPPS